MQAQRALVGQFAILLLATLNGCTSRPAETPVVDQEAPVRARFAELQAALKSHDADKLWELLDTRSRNDAERAAKEIQTMHGGASADEKRKQEDSLGVDEWQVAAMTAKSVFQTKRFQKKYDEVPLSEIEKVLVRGEHATVHYLEPDGDHEKVVFVRENGQWQAWLVMPKFKQL